MVYTFYFAYTEWHRLAYEKAKELVGEEHFDLVHYLGPIGYREPGFLWKLDLPYIWGPVGGATNAPYTLFPALSVTGRLKHAFRSVANTIQLHTNGRVKRAVKRTDLLLTATTENQNKFASIHHKESCYLPENCIMQHALLDDRKFKNRGPIELISIGTLGEERKGLIILLKALAEIKNRALYRLHVVGGGVLEQPLKAFAQEHDLNVVWHGQVPRKEVFQLLNGAHLHIITSLSEANTTAIWEAMSCGVPTLSVDHCGMHDTICDKCGFLIPIQSYGQVITDIASTLLACSADSDLLRRKAAGVLECAQKHYWEERRAFFNQCYEQTILTFKG